MRRLFLGWLVVTLPVLVACLALSGCKPVEEDLPDVAGAFRGNKAAVNAVMTPIKMGKGVIKGKVVWKGNKPDIAKLDDLRVKVMEAKPSDVKVCMSGECMKDEVTDQRYRIGNNNGVGNVVVWVMPPDKSSYFDFSDDDIKSLKLKPEKVVSQPHCAFLPHVDWAFTHYLTPDPKNPRKTKPTGQVVKIENNATISHNTKWPDTGRSIRGGNQMLSPKGIPLTLPLTPEAEPVRIQCSIHEWMDAYIWDFNHPYADITKYNLDKPDDETYGTYEIHNVPTGVKLKIVAWHEDPEKFLTPDQKITSAEVIEVKEGEPLVKDFEIVGK